MIDAGGTMWILIAVVGAVVLALGLFYASQQAKEAPRDAVTLNLKDEMTRQNFSEEAVEEKPLFAEAEAKPEPMKVEVEARKPVKTAARKRRPRIGKQRTRRNEERPSSHAVH